VDMPGVGGGSAGRRFSPPTVCSTEEGRAQRRCGRCSVQSRECERRSFLWSIVLVIDPFIHEVIGRWTKRS
jgi:hypothetical protein